MKPNKTHTPPYLAYALLKFFTNDWKNTSLIGDLEEEYFDIASKKGFTYARLWYLFHVLRSLPKLIKDSNLWGVFMFKNYFKTAWRNIKKYKTHSSLNILGLAIGMASFIFIYLWIQNELSYDKFHEKANRIYRVAVKGMINNTDINFAYTPSPLAETLVRDFPEVEAATRILQFRQPLTIRYEDKAFIESGTLFVDSTFFDVFSFPLLKGNRNTILKSSSHILITEEYANKYFGVNDAVGKILDFELNPSAKMSFQVAGVMKNIPHNSHFKFDILAPIQNFDYSRNTQWMNNFARTYISLFGNADPEQVANKFPDLIKEKIGESRENFRWSFYLQPLTDIHLKSHIDYEFEENGNQTNVYFFSVIAFIIILIACVNYTNLSTAKSINRAKEIGLRKVIGSSKKQLIYQFMSESILVSLISLVIAVALVLFSLPFYRDFVSKPVDFTILSDGIILFKLILLALFVGILSGIYPAFVLSCLKPISILRGKIDKVGKIPVIRQSLVVFQFSLSVILIISSVFVYKQVDLIKNKNLGFDKEQVVVIHNTNVLGDQSETFKNEIRNISSVANASGISFLPTGNFVGLAFKPEEFETISLQTSSCDENLLETLGMNLIAGRFFDKNFGSDNSSIVLNEASVELIGWENPVGKKIRCGDGEFNVIGVVSDIRYESIQSEVRPMALFEFNSQFNNYAENFILLKYNSHRITDLMKQIENSWNKFQGQHAFEYSFLDKDYDSMYYNEQKIGQVTGMFSVLAVFVAALGLFGLASFMAAEKTKEIGIRKTLGASTLNIINLLSRKFLLLVVISNIIAWPIAYFTLQNWLQNFYLRIPLELWVFILSGIFTLIITFLMVGYHAVKSAHVNPVDSLRTE